MAVSARALGLLLALAIGRTAWAGLSVTLAAAPPSPPAGSSFTVQLTVVNNGANPVWTVPALGWNSAVGISQASAPTGKTITAAFSDSFTWTFSASACAEVTFTGSASGTDGGTPVASGDSNPVTVHVCTPTPGVTYLPAPKDGNAVILGNLFHPMDGGQMQLRYDAPYEGKIQVDLYDRLGRHLKHLERDVLPGSYTEAWDGRGDDGLVVASGIYVAYFHGKGLNRVVKFAVLK